MFQRCRISCFLKQNRDLPVLSSNLISIVLVTVIYRICSFVVKHLPWNCNVVGLTTSLEKVFPLHVAQLTPYCMHVFSWGRKTEEKLGISLIKHDCQACRGILSPLFEIHVNNSSTIFIFPFLTDLHWKTAEFWGFPETRRICFSLKEAQIDLS